MHYLVVSKLVMVGENRPVPDTFISPFIDELVAQAVHLNNGRPLLWNSFGDFETAIGDGNAYLLVKGAD